MHNTRSLLHMGTDVGAWSLTGSGDRFHMGVMAAYGHVDTSATAADNPNRASGSVDSYAAGIYGTWFQDDVQRMGTYVDSWLMYGWQDSSVSGEGLPTQSYHSQIAAASVEGGYAFGPVGRYGVVATPLAQVIWNGYFDRNVFESATGTTVDFVSPNGLTTRLGVRVNATIDTSATTRLQPFIEAVWRYEYGQLELAMNGHTVSADGARNVAEVNVGLNGRFNARWRVWSKVGAQLGGNGKGVNGGLGMRYEY
jgi:autotransporter family porin